MKAYFHIISEMVGLRPSLFIPMSTSPAKVDRPSSAMTRLGLGRNDSSSVQPVRNVIGERLGRNLLIELAVSLRTQELPTLI